MKEKKDNLKGKISLKDKILKYQDFSISQKNAFVMTVTKSDAKCKHVLVDGVKKIKKYTAETVILDMGAEELLFCGEGLECLTYASGAIEVFGKIESISFNSESV